jgi:RimJ/RimL family protein N-acetyltransferase
MTRIQSMRDGHVVQWLAFDRGRDDRHPPSPNATHFVGAITCRPWADIGEGSGPPAGRVQRSSELELGYWVATPRAGRGFAAEILAAVTAHVFATTSAQGIGLKIHEENIPSRRVAERVGFGIFKRVHCPPSELWGPAAVVLHYRLSREGFDERMSG